MAAYPRRISMRAVRIVSLVPHATELLFALGLGDDVVGVTHECDHPAGGDGAAAGHARRAAARAELRRDRRRGARAHRARRGDLRARRARCCAELEPDLIVTQELCPVCAVCSDDVAAVAAELPDLPAGHRAGPQDVRRDDGRHPHDRAGDGRARRGARPGRPPARAGRRGARSPSATPSRCPSPRSSGSTPSSSPATGRRS